MKKLICLFLVLCFNLTAIPGLASGLSLDDPSFNDPNEREDNSSSVNTVSFGGWGGGGVSRPSSHARSETDSLLPYGALELTISPQPSATLNMGGEELPLSLEDGGLFTPEAGLWNNASFAPGEEINALCLTSEAPEARWVIPGSVLRKLNRSGVSWLILRTGDQEALLPTLPFLSGSRYDSWRKAGYTDGTFLYCLSLPQGLMEVQAGDTHSPLDECLTGNGFQISPIRGEP